MRYNLKYYGILDYIFGIVLCILKIILNWLVVYTYIALKHNIDNI